MIFICPVAKFCLQGLHSGADPEISSGGDVERA